MAGAPTSLLLPASLPERTEDAPEREVLFMANFKRIKIQATVETAAMLLTEDRIDGALKEFCDALKHLDLAILCVEPKEEAPVEFSKLEYVNKIEYLD